MRPHEKQPSAEWQGECPWCLGRFGRWRARWRLLALLDLGWGEIATLIHGLFRGSETDGTRNISLDLVETVSLEGQTQ